MDKKALWKMRFMKNNKIKERAHNIKKHMEEEKRRHDNILYNKEHPCTYGIFGKKRLNISERAKCLHKFRESHPCYYEKGNFNRLTGANLKACRQAHHLR